MTSRFRKTVLSFFSIERDQARHKKLRKRIQEGAAIDGIHICQLIAAMIIASIGLNVDSTEAVIGAMLICPLMGSVLAISHGIASLDRRMLREALIGLMVQTVICLATSTIYFIISPLSHQTSELLSNSYATVWDVLIAFVGGFAGALGVSRRQEPATLIAGVAVATALMPPLCSTGFGIASRDWVVGLGAFYEFLINVVFIAFGSELVFVWIRVPLIRDLNGDGLVSIEEDREAHRRSKSLRFRVVVGSIIFAIPCLFFSANMVKSAMEANGTTFEVVDKYGTEHTTRELQVLYPEFVNYRIGSQESFDLKQGAVKERLVATVVTSSELTDQQKENMRKLIDINVSGVDDVEFEVDKKTSQRSTAGQGTTGQNAPPDQGTSADQGASESDQTSSVDQSDQADQTEEFQEQGD